MIIPLIGHALAWLRLDAQHLTIISTTFTPLALFQGSKAEFNERAEIMQNSKVFQEPVLASAHWIQALQTRLLFL